MEVNKKEVFQKVFGTRTENVQCKKCEYAHYWSPQLRSKCLCRFRRHKMLDSEMLRNCKNHIPMKE